MVNPDYVKVAHEVVASHHARLGTDAQQVPAGDVIALVHGDGVDPISEEFLLRLHASAKLIGDHTDVVRAQVTQNADALKQAADDLMSVDDAAAQDFGTVAEIVTATAADTTPEDVAAAAGAGVQGH